MKNKPHSQIQRARRHKRVRARISGTTLRPRLSVFRSNRFMYAQVIDDAMGRTLVGLRSALDTSSSAKKGVLKKEAARVLGKELARMAIEKRIKQVIFDRGGYRYQGRVQALAEGAREGGLEF